MALSDTPCDSILAYSDRSQNVPVVLKVAKRASVRWVVYRYKQSEGGSDARSHHFLARHSAADHSMASTARLARSLPYSKAHLVADSVRPGSDRAQATFRPDGQDLLELVNSRWVHVDLYKRQLCLELSASKYLRNGRYCFMA